MRVAFFAAIAPCLPPYFGMIIPLPGVTTFFELTCYKVIVILVLLPCLFAHSGEERKFGLPDAMLLLYASLTAAVMASLLNATSGLRFFIDQLLIIVLPFMAIRRSIRTAKDLDLVMQGFVLAAILAASMALSATLKQWDFYRLYEPISVFRIPDIRESLLRIGLTAGTHALGYHLAAGMLMIEALRSRKSFPFRSALVLQPLLLLGIYVTHSRGAMGGLAVGLIIMTVTRNDKKSLRYSLAGVLAIAGAYGSFILLSWDFTDSDPYGTIAYRQDLFETSIRQIWSHPWFGDFSFYNSEEFSHLRQGQGIIDVTNLFLLLPLYYGLPAALLFFTVAAAPLVKLFGQPVGNGHQGVPSGVSAPVTPSTRVGQWNKVPAFALREFTMGGVSAMSLQLSGRVQQNLQPPLASPERAASGRAVPPLVRATRNPGTDRGGNRKVQAALAGSVAGWLFLVTTTSDLGLTMHVGIVLVAIAAAATARDFDWSL